MTLSKETAISEMKGRERKLIIAIRDMRKRHAEELADIRERLYFMKRKNREQIALLTSTINLFQRCNHETSNRIAHTR